MKQLQVESSGRQLTQDDGLWPAIMCIAQLCALAFGGFAEGVLNFGLERF